MAKQKETWVCVDCGKNTGEIPDLEGLTLVEILKLGHENRCKQCREDEESRKNYY